MKKFKLSKFIQWRFNIFLYIIMGWSFAKFYIFLLGKIYFLFNRREKKIIDKSIKDVISWVKREINIPEVSKNVFKGIFAHYYEKLFMAFEEKQKATEFLNKHVNSDNLVVVRTALLKGKGVIVITGHYGAIEYIPTLLAVNNIDISMIAKFKTSQLRNKIFKQAEKYKIRMIDAGNSGNVLKRAISELKENRVLVTQCDEIEEWRPSLKKRTSFLGQVTGLDRTINILHKRTGAEVVFGVIHRYNLRNYKFIAYSYEQMLKIIPHTNSNTVGEVVLKVLEQFICHYPEQWYQWKKYPDLINLQDSESRVEERSITNLFYPLFEKIA